MGAIFLRSVAANNDKVTSVTGGNAASTGETNAAGDSIIYTAVTGATYAAALTMVFATGLFDTNAAQGLYSCTVNADNADTESAAFLVPVFGAAGTLAVGKPTRATSSLKAAAPGLVTFNLGIQQTQAADTTLTITASEAIFTASAAAATAPITVLTLNGVNKMATTASTIATDATGKIATIVLKEELTYAAASGALVAITVQTVMANNPSTAGLVTLEMKSSVSTTAASTTYTIFDAASTALYLGAAVGTDEISVSPASLSLSMVPQTVVPAAGTVTFTASTAIFTASSTPACALAPVGGASVGALCSSAADSTGKILTITTASVPLTAGVPYTFAISDNLATSSGTAGAGPTFTLKTSADATVTSATAGYYLFAAALTPYFVSASATTLTGLAAPGNVILTANAAVFDPSGSYPGTGCVGTDCIVCTSKKDLMTTTVPCTAAADSTGKILTVTASTASTTTDSNDFTANQIGQIALTNHMVNPNATAVTFALTTGVDTASTGAQTGYTTTSVAAAAGAAPSPPGATNTGTYSTATTTVSFTGYTYVAGTATTNFANVVGCAYAKTVSDATTSLTSHMCGASSGPTFTYMTGASTTNTASAARRTGTSVAVGLKMYHPLISQTAATAAVTAVGTSLTAINANLAAINTAAGTGFSTTQITATGMTAATWTHSSAAVVVPSMMAMFSALVLVLMQ